MIYSGNKGCRYLYWISGFNNWKQAFKKGKVCWVDDHDESVYLAYAIIGLKLSKTVLQTSFMDSLSAALTFFALLLFVL